MKISIRNLGIFKQAEYELGDLTIICGENNTGKTYATYALYGFFDFWKNGFILPVDRKDVDKLMDTGTVTIKLPAESKEINMIMEQACSQYKRNISKIFAASEEVFKTAEISILPDMSDIKILDTFSSSFGTISKELIQISKESGKNEISVNLLSSKEQIDTSATRVNINFAIGISIKEIVFGRTFTDVFIASAERTGAVIFKNELNIERNNLLKEAVQDVELEPMDLLNKVYSSKYALPVRRNIDFIRKIEDIAKDESFISKQHPELLAEFADLIGGEFKIAKDGLFFIPKGNKKIKLTIGESSSSVRSLFDLGFYLRNVAEPGDMLMIDEPELNLHPANQCRLARLFSRLVGLGIKVFITTHSDYIIKELNTLIMLYCRKENDNTAHLMRNNGYMESELLNPDRVKVFISEMSPVLCDGNKKRTNVQALVPAEIDHWYGIEARSFDTTILKMNKIQESIILDRK